MWKVKGKNVTFNVMTLDEAMHTAKAMNEFVTITGADYEVVGMFGVDDIEDKVLPDGTSYEWTMRRDENKSWRKKNM